jgi:hypothetical protein
MEIAFHDRSQAFSAKGFMKRDCLTTLGIGTLDGSGSFDHKICSALGSHQDFSLNNTVYFALVTPGSDLIKYQIQHQDKALFP